jgi:hypothetical protein
MNLKCHKCNSNNTVLVRKSCLEKALGGLAPLGASGVVANPLAVITAIAGIVAAFFAYLQYKLLKQSEFVCICKDCGYWERL